MRQSSAIALLLFYLLVNTELQEMVRIPVLFQHYAEHKQLNKEVSFAGFIVLHYFSGEVKDGDAQRDQQLPFKGAHCEEVTTSIAIPAESFKDPLPEVSFAMIKTAGYVSLFNSSLFQFTIWQPPRA